MQKSDFSAKDGNSVRGAVAQNYAGSDSYLRYESSHPPHCKKSLPYSQFLRLRRICSREADFHSHSQEMMQHFLDRGYPATKLIEDMAKVAALDRATLIAPRQSTVNESKSDETQLTLYAITRYHPTSNDFRDIIDKNWVILGSPGIQTLYESKVIFGHKRPKNLREHLVRAVLKSELPLLTPQEQAKKEKAKSCGSPGRCNYCPKLDTSGMIRDNSDGRRFRTRTSITCRSNNLIYAIECTQCGMRYVGQTKTRLMDRMVNHFATIHGQQEK